MKKNKIAQMSAALRHANKKSRAMIFKKMAIVKIFLVYRGKAPILRKNSGFLKKIGVYRGKTRLKRIG